MSLYTPFSNYKEENQENRIKAADKMADYFGDDKDKYIAYRKEWNKAQSDASYIPKVPLNVVIDASSACNFRCKGCFQSTESDLPDLGQSKDDDTLSIIKQCADIGVPSISFTHRGEPTLNKSLPEYIRYARKLGILETRMVTNGSDPFNMLEDCIEAGLDILIISIDGFSAKTMEPFRKGSDYHRVVSNTFKCLDFKKEFGGSFIRIQCVRHSGNEHEIEDFIEYWSKVKGVDDVRISDITNRNNENFSEMTCGDQKTTGRKACPQIRQRLIFTNTADQALPCCYDWKNEYELGSIKEKSIMELWNSPKLNKLRDIHAKGLMNVIPMCSGCGDKSTYVWSKK